MKIIYSTAIFLLVVFACPVKAQEYVTGLVKNRIVEDASLAQKFSLKSFNSQADTVPLPFFDDFSTNTVFPDKRWWTDNYAFVNSQFAVNPPTIGVATLDALDQNGALYSKESYTSFPADTLSSKFINLNYPVDSNIYLSFFYQAKGLGHMPKATDSLLVQFYAPRQHKWKRAWGIPGDSLRPFKQILIPIKDTAYLHRAFRFRFMNYASLSQSLTDPGRVGDNSDWNIDYVYLNKGRNDHDTVLKDLAILSPLPSLLSYFEAIPWAHFPYAADELMAFGKTSVYYHYYDANPLDSIGHDRILKINSVSPNYAYTLINTENIHAQTTTLDEPYYDKLPYEKHDSALFNVIFYIDQKGLNDNYIHRWNDTVRRVQVFKDYYAYDDGTAENGYGLLGQGTKNASVAYQFFCYTPDSLRAIDMYFNDVYKDANAKLFDLTVWDSQNGSPANILFTKSDTSLFPTFQSRNHFIRYVLDQPVALQDTFYVGWTQTTDGFLNVGLDVNKVNNQKMFFNINGSWQMSSIKGSLMIRPVFGNRISTGVKQTIVSQSIRLYPNPASDQVTIEIENKNNIQLHVSFYDLSGKLLLSSVTSGKPLNISSLENGMYIVRIESGQSTAVFRKLRVIR
jgi:hypothetical protein